MKVEDRLDALEARTKALETIVRQQPRPIITPPARPTGILAGPPAPREPVAPPPPRVSAPREPVAAPPRRTLRDFDDLEDALGGRVLAWVGGLAVTLGVIFLLAIAVSRGWIGEAERTLLAGLLSGGLLAAGIRLHGRRGRTDAAKAATAAGIVGLFATALVAGSV